MPPLLIFINDPYDVTKMIEEAIFSCFQVYSTHTAPDYSLPWQKQRQYTSIGSAFMIGEGKLLTNAHCVKRDSQVKVKKRCDDTKYVAKVLARGVECDIALLSVESEEFWKGAEPLRFGRLPRLQLANNSLDISKHVGKKGSNTHLDGCSNCCRISTWRRYHFSDEGSRITYRGFGGDSNISGYIRIEF